MCYTWFILGWWNLRLPLQWCTYYTDVGQLPSRAYNKPHPCCCLIPSNSSKVWGTKKPPSCFAVLTCDHYGEYLHGVISQWPIPIMKVANTKHRSQDTSAGHCSIHISNMRYLDYWITDMDSIHISNNSDNLHF